MKKIFTFFAAALMAVSVMADEAPAISAISVKESEKNPGNLNIYWMADSTISKVYLVYLYAADIVTYQTTPIAYLAAYASNFAISGYPGYYGVGSDAMLQYGQTYLTLKENPQVPEDVLAKFKAGWEENVDATDFTLNAGYYFVVVTGYDATGKTITETANQAIVEVKGKSEGIINVFESNKPVKFMDASGQVRILRDGKVYNMSGARIE